MSSTAESQEAAVKFHHNLNRMQDSLKEYVHLIELLGTARNRLEAARQNNGDTAVWENWINENQTKIDKSRESAGEAFDEIHRVLGCKPDSTKTKTNTKKKTAGKVSKRG